MVAVGAHHYPALDKRTIPNTVFLFDVDNTLTPARQPIDPELLEILGKIREQVAIGFVGGSNLEKQQEQIGKPAGANVTELFDFCFAENGLTAYKSGVQLASQSFIGWLGQEKYKPLVNFILHYIADLDIPEKTGTFVEFRNGMINVSPIGRNATLQQRDEYEKYDIEHKIRETMVTVLREKFPDLGLTYSIGGKISFDVFPHGWDKRYCLNHLENEAKLPGGVTYTTVHFFGDKTDVGGNDYELYTDPRTIGHSVKDPNDTKSQLKKLFNL